MGIEISINAGESPEESTIKFSGSIQHIITDKEIKTFDIQDANLKNAIGKYFEKNPNDAYLKSPTLWNDLYKYDF
ncbi:MAG: hypothetical protein KME52_27085 [Desmonostoc geniculatum HA4340-LM1]|jgi:hypothetical protein|nr:hypothetical protein [Desmonostoc geniculatum HA4340-LM1]